MPRTKYEPSQGPQREAESQLIMGGARLKLKAARVLSTQRLIADAKAAEEQARQELSEEMRAQAEHLTPEQRAEIAAYLVGDSEVSAT